MEVLLEIYHRLLSRYGPQHWWPGDGPFEMMVGAVLTQSVAWINVEKALSNLKAEELLNPKNLRCAPMHRIANAIRPAGYYNAKAKKLKALAAWLDEYCRDNLADLSRHATAVLRNELLAVHGIGEETADSILLYSCDKPTFVVDAYTRRIVDRLGFKPTDHRYISYQALFTDSLSPDIALYNEYHALMVRHGKDVCRKLPLCPQCCLTDICDYAMEKVQYPRNRDKV